MRALLQSSSFLILFHSLSTAWSGIHSTRFKDRILAQLPNLRASREGRDIVFAFDADVGSALRKACDKNFDDEAVCLARAAKIVRRDMLKLHSRYGTAAAV